MSSSYWGYWLIVMGVAIVGLMISVNGITTTTTQNYLSIKEVTEASMLEAVDYGYYRDYNEIKINKEKFMEVFLRMIAETMGTTDTYEVNFYGIYEAPPKVSVEIKSNSGTDFVSTGYDTISRHDAIIQAHAQEVITNENNSSSSTPSTPEQKPEETVACKTGITSFDATNMMAYPMAAISVYDSKEHKNEIGKTNTNASDTEALKILGRSDSDSKWWAVEYGSDSCGWIDSTYVAVNMQEYEPRITYDIKNASTSIYQSSGVPLNMGNLYNSKYKPLGTYMFAQKIKKAADLAAEEGVHLVVNDAYRPKGVTDKLYNTFSNLYNSNETVKKGVRVDFPNGKGFYLGDFVATGVSTHNTACAVDITFSGANMPSAMHELSVAAAFKVDKVTKTTNADALKLNRIMEGAGLTNLLTEWWHYQDNTCHNNIKGITGSGAKFWAS